MHVLSKFWNVRYECVPTVVHVLYLKWSERSDRTWICQYSTVFRPLFATLFRFVRFHTLCNPIYSNFLFYNSFSVPVFSVLLQFLVYFYVFCCTPIYTNPNNRCLHSVSFLWVLRFHFFWCSKRGDTTITSLWTILIVPFLLLLRLTKGILQISVLEKLECFPLFSSWSKNGAKSLTFLIYLVILILFHCWCSQKKVTENLNFPLIFPIFIELWVSIYSTQDRHQARRHL